jgi:hypothetical protein
MKNGHVDMVVKKKFSVGVYTPSQRTKQTHTKNTSAIMNSRFQVQHTHILKNKHTGDSTAPARIVNDVNDVVVCLNM